MPDPMTGIAIGAVGAGGAAVYSATQAPGVPDIGPAPPPANYVTYDEDGNIAGSQSYNAETNTYEYRPAPLTTEQIEDKRVRLELKNQMLANLSQTPEDRIAAYDQYAQTFSDVLHKNVDEQYDKTATALAENLERTGMTGSRADVDKTSELVKQKLSADVDIAQRSELAKEDLAARDRNYWLNLLKYSDTKASADEITALRKSGQAAQIAHQGTADIMGRYGIESQNEWNQWQADLEKNTALTQAFAGLGGNLAFMSAYGGGGTPDPLKGTPAATKDIGSRYGQKTYGVMNRYGGG